MQSAQPSLFTRPDTFFGVCEAIGQDLGFNPNYLRIAFGVTVLLSPIAVLAIYAAFAAIVGLSRWLYPSRPVDAGRELHGSPADAAPSPKAEIDEFALAA